MDMEVNAAFGSKGMEAARLMFASEHVHAAASANTELVFIKCAAPSSENSVGALALPAKIFGCIANRPMDAAQFVPFVPAWPEYAAILPEHRDAPICAAAGI